jgi:hypothetical protein
MNGFGSLVELSRLCHARERPFRNERHRFFEDITFYGNQDAEVR